MFTEWLQSDGILISACLQLLERCRCSPSFSAQPGDVGRGNMETHGGYPRDPKIKPRQILALFGVRLAWASHRQPLVQRDVVSSLHNEMKHLSLGPLLHRTVGSLAKACAPTWNPLTKREGEYSPAFIHSLNRYRWRVCPVSSAALEPRLPQGGSAEY